MILFLNTTIGALMAGGLLGLAALGMNLAYRLTRVINLSQGAVVVVGALVFDSSARLLPIGIAVILALAAGALAGIILERIAITPALKRLPSGSILVITVGALLVYEGLSKIIWGSRPYTVPTLPPDTVWEFGGVRVPSQAVWIIGLLAVVGVGCAIFFTRTRTGMAIRAASENPDTAMVMGVNIVRLRILTFAAAGILAAAAGVLSGPVFSLAYNSGTNLTNLAFIAIVLGGLGSVIGGIAGGLTVGLFQQYAAAYIPQMPSNVIVLMVLMVILVLRPQGLLRSVRSRTDVAASTAHVAERTHSRLRPRNAYILGALVVLVVALLPFGVNSTVLTALVITGILSIALLGLDIVVGFSGQISLGHAAFMAIGGYTTAILTSAGILDLWPALLAGVALTVVCALLLSLATNRLSGLYVALATLAFGQLVESLITGSAWLTGGSIGIAGIPRMEIFGIPITSQGWYWFVWAIVVVLIVGLWNISASDLGRSLRSIKADPAAARSIGIPVSRYKSYAFVLGAALAGLAGGFYASFLQFLSPDIMGVGLSFTLITMLILGGEGTLVGPIIGAALLTLLPTQVQFVSTNSELVEGVLLIAILLLMPNGLWGGLVDGLSRLTRRRRPTASSSTSTAASDSELTGASL